MMDRLRVKIKKIKVLEYVGKKTTGRKFLNLNVQRHAAQEQITQLNT